jgi:N-methylhydantoinase A
LRYRGQEHAIAIPVESPADLAGEAIRQRFNAQHDRRHGHAAPDQAIEIVCLRLVVSVPRMDDTLGRWLAAPFVPEQTLPAERRTIVYDDPRHPVEAAILWRPGLVSGTEVSGPAVIEEPNATTFVPPGDHAVIDARGNIAIAVAAPSW